MICRAAWQTILVDAQSEGLLGLASTCSQQQLLNIANPAAPVCTPTQIQTKDNGCKCCDPNFGCANLVNPAANVVTAMISYLAKFDSSAVVSTGAPNANFPMLDGVKKTCFAWVDFSLRLLTVRNYSWHFRRHLQPDNCHDFSERHHWREAFCAARIHASTRGSDQRFRYRRAAISRQVHP